MIGGRAMIDATTVSMHELGHDGLGRAGHVGLIGRIMAVWPDGTVTVAIKLGCLWRWIIVRGWREVSRG